MLYMLFSAIFGNFTINKYTAGSRYSLLCCVNPFCNMIINRVNACYLSMYIEICKSLIAASSSAHTNAHVLKLILNRNHGIISN